MVRITEKDKTDALIKTIGDDTSRQILLALIGTQRTATELSGETGVPLASVYRKLNEMSRTGLVSISSFTIVGGKKEATHYSTVREICIMLNEGRAEIVLAPSKSEVEILWMRLFSIQQPK